MSKNKRLIVAELNPHLVCALCGGYYVDATTVIECLHTFCKSCIVRYLETSKFCPTCDVLVHKTKPLLSIRPDKSLQNIVYKLIPGLYKDEMKRRRKFYLENDEVKPTSEEDGGCHLNSEYLLPGDLVSIAMKPLPSQSEEQTDCNSSHTRFFNCPAGVTMGQLKRLLRGKFSLPRNHPVQFSAYKEDVLQDDITLIDVAYIKSWKKDLPLILYYKIYFTKKIKLDPLLEERAIKLEAEPSPLSEDYSMPQLEPETENLWLPESEDRVLPKLSPIADILPLSAPDSLPKDPPLLTCAQELIRTNCSLSLTCSQNSTSKDPITLDSGQPPLEVPVQNSLKDPLNTITTDTTFTKDTVSSSVQVFPPQIPQPLSVLDPPRIVSPPISTQNEGVVKMTPTYSVPKSTTSVTSFKTIIPAPVRPVPEVMNFSSLAIPTIDSLGTRDCNYSYRIGLLAPPSGNVPSLFPGSIVDPTKLGGTVLPFGLTLGPGLICAPPPVNNLNVSFPSPDQSSISNLSGLTIQPLLSSTESNPSNIILPYSNLETSVVHSMPSQPISSILQSEPTKLASSGISPSKGCKKPKLIRPKKSEVKPSLEEKEVQLMISETGVMIVSGEGDKTSNHLEGLINPVYSEANELLTKIESGSLLSSEPYSEDSKESDISDGAEKLAQIKQEISSILNNLSNDPQCNAVVADPEFIGGNISVSSSTSLNISENQNVALSSCASNVIDEPLLMVYTKSSSTSECSPDKFKTSSDDKSAETENKNKIENVSMNVNNSALQTKSKLKSGVETLEKKKEDIPQKEVPSLISHPEPHSIKKPNNAVHPDDKTSSTKDQSKKRTGKKYPQPMGYKTLKFSPRGWNPTISREKIQKKLNASIPLKPSKFFKARNSAILSNAIKSEQSDAVVSEPSKSPAQAASKASTQPSQLASTPVSEVSKKIDHCSHQTNNILKNKDAQKLLIHTSTLPSNKRNQSKETSEIRVNDSSSKTVRKEGNSGHLEMPKSSVAQNIPDTQYHTINKERNKPEKKEKGESKEGNIPSTKRQLNNADFGAPNPKRLGNKSHDSLQGETCKQELPKPKEGKSSQDDKAISCSISEEQKFSTKDSSKDDSKFCSAGSFPQATLKKSAPRKHQLLVTPSTSSPNPSAVTSSTTSDVTSSTISGLVTSSTSLGIVTSSDSLTVCVSTSPLSSLVSVSSSVACSKPLAAPDDLITSKFPIKTVPSTSNSISQLTTDKNPSTSSGSVSRLIPKQSSYSPAKKQNTEAVMAASVKCKDLPSKDIPKGALLDKFVAETKGAKSCLSTGSGNNNESKIVDESMSNNCQSVSKNISQVLPEDTQKNSKSTFYSTPNASLPISKSAEVPNKIKNSPTRANKVDQPSLNIKADSSSVLSKDAFTPSLESTQDSSKIQHKIPQTTPRVTNCLEQQIQNSPCSTKSPTRTSITVDQLVPKSNFTSGRQDTNFDVKLSTSSIIKSNVSTSLSKNQPLEPVPEKQSNIPLSYDKLYKTSSNLSSINPVSNNDNANILKDSESSLGDNKLPSLSDSSTRLVKGNKPDTHQNACGGPISNKVCSISFTPTANNKEENSPSFKPPNSNSSNDKENNNDRNKNNNNDIKVDQRNKSSKENEFSSTHSSASVSQSTKAPSSSISPILNKPNRKVTFGGSTKSSIGNSSSVNCPTSRPILSNNGSVVNNLCSANTVPSSNSTPSFKSSPETKHHPNSKISSLSLKEATVPPVSAEANSSSIENRSNQILTTQTSPKSASALEGNVALSSAPSSSVSSLPNHFGNKRTTTSSSQNSNGVTINSYAVSSSSCSYSHSSKENTFKPQTSCEQAVALSMNASRAVANRKHSSASIESDKNSVTNTSTISSGLDTISKVSYDDKSLSKPISDSHTAAAANAKINSSIATTSQSKISSNLTVTQNTPNTPNIPKSQSTEVVNSSPLMTSQNSHHENIPFPLHNNISSQCADNFYFSNSIQNCSMPFFNNFMPFHNVPITNSNISSSNINSYASTTSCSSHLQSQNRGKASQESTKVTSSTPATSSSISVPMESINSASPCPSLNVPTLQDASKFIQNLLSPHSISNASLDPQKAGVKSTVEELDRFLLQTISSTVPEAKISDLFSSSLTESNESMKMNKIEKASNTNSCLNLDASVKSNSQSVPSVSVPIAKDSMNCTSTQNSVHSMQSMSMTSKAIPTTSHVNPRDTLSSSSENTMSFQNMLNDASPSFQRSAANSSEASHKVPAHVPVMSSQAYTTVVSTLATVESSYKPMYHQNLCCKHQTDSSNQVHGHPLQPPSKSANNHNIHQPLKGNEHHVQVSSSLGKKPESTDKRTMAIASSAPATYGSYSDVNFNNSSTPTVPGESSMNKKAQRPSGYLGSNSIANPHQSSHQFPSFALNSMMSFHEGVAGISSPNLSNAHKHSSQATSWDSNPLNPFILNNSGDSYSASGANKAGFAANANNCIQQNLFRNNNATGVKDQNLNSQSQTNFNASNICSPKSSTGLNAQYQTESNVKKNASNMDYYENFSVGSQKYNASLYYSNYNNNYANFFSNSQGQGSPSLTSLVSGAGYNFPLSGSKFTSGQQYLNSSNNSYFSSGNFNVNCGTNYQNCINQPSTSNAGSSNMSSNLGNNFSGPLCNISLPYYSNCSFSYNSYPSYFCQGGDMSLLSPTASFIPPFSCLSPRPSLSSRNSSSSQSFNDFSLQSGFFPMVPFVSPLQGNGARATPSPVGGGISSSFGARPFSTNYSQKTNEAGKGTHKTSQTPKPGNVGGPSSSKTKHKKTNAGSKTKTPPTKDVESKTPRTESLHPSYVNSDVATSSPSRTPQSLHASVPVSCTSGFGSNETQRIGEIKTKGKEG